MIGNGSGGRRYAPLQAVVIMRLFKEVFQKMVRKRCASHGSMGKLFARKAAWNLNKPLSGKPGTVQNSKRKPLIFASWEDPHKHNSNNKDNNAKKYIFQKSLHEAVVQCESKYPAPTLEDYKSTASVRPVY